MLKMMKFRFGNILSIHLWKTKSIANTLKTHKSPFSVNIKWVRIHPRSATWVFSTDTEIWQEGSVPHAVEKASLARYFPGDTSLGLTEVESLGGSVVEDVPGSQRKGEGGPGRLYRT